MELTRNTQSRGLLACGPEGVNQEHSEPWAFSLRACKELTRNTQSRGLQASLFGRARLAHGPGRRVLSMAAPFDWCRPAFLRQSREPCLFFCGDSRSSGGSPSLAPLRAAAIQKIVELFKKLNRSRRTAVENKGLNLMARFLPVGCFNVGKKNALEAKKWLTKH